MISARTIITTLAAAGALATGVGLAIAAGPDDPGTDRVARALALAERPTADPRTSEVIPPDEGRAVADRRAVDVPLPTGGTFSGIRWEEVGGRVTVYDVDLTLEYNAACQWLRAKADRRDLDDVDGVLAAAPRWPNLRVSGSGEVLDDVISGRAAPDVAAGVLQDCRASHGREVAYARQLGLPPSS